jgi:hypothetical protein
MRIHQPIQETAGRVETSDGAVEVLPYQIVVMVSIAAKSVIALPADAPRLPAVLDTGDNHRLQIRMSWRTSPATSVRRKRRPLCR